MSAALEVNRINGTSHNESTLHVEGRGGHATIFRAKKLQSLTTYDLNGTLNLKTGTGGEIRLQDITGSVLDGSILEPCVVWDGRSYAMLGDTADEDGYFLVQPLPDASYATAFVPEIKTEIVDLENDTSVSATEIVGSLRFRNRNGANLTLDASLSLYGGGGWSGHRGAILVTPDLGETPVVIGGASPLGAHDVNGSLYVHQYNPSAPLIIDAQVNASQSGNRVVKSGPGELILTHPDNRFGTLSIQNGTLSVTSITNSGTPSAAGCGSDIFLRSATFRYLGEGDETNRKIVLGGDGTLEASGNGRLTLTGETAVAAKDGADYEITLAGTGEGEILGNISIELGRVIKRGTGTWCLAGADSIFRNGLSVEEGTLRLEGKVGRNVEVAGGATLLSAGGSILRNLVLEPEATLGYVAKSAPLQVGGRVLLNDAKVSISGNLPPFEDVEILRAEGGVEGTVLLEDSGRYRVRYTDNSVYVSKLRATLFIVR